MKIDCRLEDDNSPVLFFPDEQNPRNRAILCYSRIGQHSEASRGYMRDCRKPKTQEEIKSCLDLLIEWARA